MLLLRSSSAFSLSIAVALPLDRTANELPERGKPTSLVVETAAGRPRGGSLMNRAPRTTLGSDAIARATLLASRVPVTAAPAVSAPTSQQSAAHTPIAMFLMGTSLVGNATDAAYPGPAATHSETPQAMS